MTVSSVSSTDQSSIIQQLLASLQTTVGNALNELDPADSTGSTQGAGQGSAGTAGSPPPPPPPRPDGAGSDLFSSDTLSGLIQAQERPSASQAAANLISGADTDGSGTLSLSEVEQALDGGSSSTDGASSSASTSSTADASALQAAFAKLDANGDGQLSQDEVAAGLQKLGGGHHGHHHHHGAYAAAAAATDASTTATSTSTASTSTGATSGASAATDVTA